LDNSFSITDILSRLRKVLLWICLSVLSSAAQTAAMPDSMPVPSASPTPVTLANPAVSANSAQALSTKPLTLAEAIDLSLQQASAFKSAQINQQIAAEDVKQAKAAFYPKVVAAPTVIYTTPSLGNTVTAGVTDGNFAAVTSRPPSFLGANAVSEFQALINTSGEIDTSGKLKATLKRNQALLESARLGGEIARRDLIGGVQDAYYALALAELQRRGAETNLQSAQEFENYEKLQLDAGEIAPIDLTRARLQRATRSDELEQAKTAESVAAGGLRVLIGYDPSASITTEDLLMQMPGDNEIENFAQTTINSRPEFAQFEADRQAAEEDVKAAKAERRPQITYSIGSGFISDSLKPRPIYNSLGIQATIGVTIPLFDKGASRSRETQAKLKIEQAENNRQLAEKQFVQAFYTARTQAVSARERIRRLGASLTDAEANVTASQARYRAGEAPITEVTDANNTLVTLRLAFYQAIYDYQSARTKLARAAGQ
jgi:outer membrane protein